jgi:beta-phosphoglucomutase-like phosphatase (HAD superfamily)
MLAATAPAHVAAQNSSDAVEQVILLAFLDGRGLPVAVATSSETNFTAFSLRQAGLEGRFAVVVTGDEVANGKPAPDIYLEAAGRLQVAPRTCIVLEDSEPGILAANRTGMRAVLIPHGIRPSEAAVQAAFRVLGSLSEAHDLVARLVVDSGSRQTAG